MRKGYDAALVFDKKGEIFAIATGSDATAEHECGSRPLMNTFCENPEGRATSGWRGFLSRGGAASANGTESVLIEALRNNKEVSYPSLFERKKLQYNLDKLIFVEGAEKDGTPSAVLGYAPHGPSHIRVDHPELWPGIRGESVTGAWDEESFAVRVSGQRQVEKLHRFFEKLQKGDGIFAGTFLSDTSKVRLSGVIIALQSALRPEHKAAIQQAQLEWEASIRLKARSRVEELYALCRSQDERDKPSMPGYVWPVWKDGVVDGEVLYALNPGYGVEADYWGPYEFEELARWVTSRHKFRLTPVKRKAA